MKRPALQNNQVVLLRMAFRARKVLGTFEKRAPGIEYRTLWKTFAKITNLADCQIYGLGIVFLCQSRDIIGNLNKDGVNDPYRLGVNLWNYQ